MMQNSLNKSQTYDEICRLIYQSLFVLLFSYILFYPHMIIPLNVWIGKATIIMNIIAIAYFSLSFILQNRFMLSWILMVVLAISFFCSSGEADGNQLFQNVTSFLCLACMLEGVKNIYVDKKLIKFISYFNILIFLIFLVYSKLDFAYRFESDEKLFELDELTLGYSNSNASSMMLLYVATINLISARMKIYNKYIALVIQILLTYLIYKTSSRTALLCVIVLSASSLFTIKKISKIFLYIFTAIPIGYIFLLPYLKSIGFLTNTEILGKSLYTGREDIFAEQTAKLNNTAKWLFGDLSVGGFLNHHNGMLSILLSCGIVGLLIYLVIWFKNITPYLNKTNKVSYIAIASLFVIFLQSSSESAFLVGSIPYAVMLVTLFIFVKFEGEKNEITSY